MITIRAACQGARYKKDADGNGGIWGVWRFWSKKEGDFIGTGVLTKEVLIDSLDLALQGQWVHTKYGRQFKFSAASPPTPNTREGTIAFLQLAPGIGPKRAERAWEKYGEDAINQVMLDPSFIGIPGTGEEVRNELRSRLDCGGDIVALFGLFAKSGVPKTLASRVVSEGLAGAYGKIIKNPFILRAIKGVGFSICDKVRRKLKLSATSPERVQAAIDEVFSRRSGDVWINAHVVLAEANELLNVHEDIIKVSINDAIKGKKLKLRGLYLALMKQANYEREIAKRLFDLMAGDASWPRLTEADGVKKHQVSEYNKAINGRLAVLMGSAGTGKSYVTAKVIAKLPQELVCALAPTGKAAQQLTRFLRSQGSSVTATTVHSALGWRPKDSKRPFAIDGMDGGTLNAKLVVLDEASMASQEIAIGVLKALRSDSKLMLVGDPNQLPPIGCGALLRDWVRFSDRCQMAQYGLLSEIRRNVGKIVHIGDGIAKGKFSKIDVTPKDLVGLNYTSQTNFQLLGVNNVDEAATSVSRILKRLRDGELQLANGVPADIRKDVQIVVANNEGTPVARKEINEAMQKFLSPSGLLPSSCYSFGSRKFIVGDRMICLKNGVYDCISGADSGDGAYLSNGDIGFCVAAGQSGVKMRLERDESIVVNLDPEDLDCFDLGYAITCHRAQGSQFKIVIVVYLGAYKEMCVVDRSWLYTAVTRAEDLCILVSSEKIVRKSIKQSRINLRKTFLRDILEEYNGHGCICDPRGYARAKAVGV